MGKSTEEQNERKVTVPFDMRGRIVGIILVGVGMCFFQDLHLPLSTIGAFMNLSKGLMIISIGTGICFTHPITWLIMVSINSGTIAISLIGIILVRDSLGSSIFFGHGFTFLCILGFLITNNTLVRFGLTQIGRDTIARALVATPDNRKAAKELKISQNTLKKLCQIYNIQAKFDS